MKGIYKGVKYSIRKVYNARQRGESPRGWVYHGVVDGQDIGYIASDSMKQAEKHMKDYIIGTILYEREREKKFYG